MRVDSNELSSADKRFLSIPTVDKNNQQIPWSFENLKTLRITKNI